MIAELYRPALNRRPLAWSAGAVGVALLAWLALSVNWIAPLAVVGLVGVALLFLRWPWLGCALLIASVPVQQLGATGPMTVTRASIPIAFAGYLIWLTVHRRTLVLSRFVIPFGLWLLWMLVTLTVADDQALAGAELARWAIAFGAFLITTQFLVGAPRSRIIAIVAFMAVAGALEATIGTILSLLAFGPESFQVGDAFSRAFGTFGRPNTFAGYLEMTIFPVAWLAVDQAARCWPCLRSYVTARRHGMVASRRERRTLGAEIALLVLLAGSSTIMLAGITASYSRGAWLGVALGATFSALLFLRRAWLLVLAASPLLLVLLVFALSSLAPAALTDRITSITDELRPFDAAAIPITDANFAVVERMAHWQAGWHMFEDEPLTGVGVGNFNDAYPDYFVRTEFRFSQGHAHNYYIHVLAETGVVGLVLYVTIMLGFLLLASYVGWSAPSGTSRMLALGAVGGLTAVMVHNLFENLHVLNLGIQISALWALSLCAHDRWRSGGRSPASGEHGILCRMNYERMLMNESREPVAETPDHETNGEGSEIERPISLGERMRSPRTIASFVIAAIIIFLAFRSLNVNFSDVVTQVRNANPFYLVLAFVSYYVSFPIRATRWRFLLRNAGISRTAGYAVPNTLGLSEIYLLSWFVNCVVPAKLGDAYRGYLLKKNAGPSFSRTLGTIFAERLLDVVALVGLMVISGLFVFQGTVPGNLRGWFIAGGVLVFVGISGLIVLMTLSHRIERVVPARARPYYSRLSDGIVTSFSRNGFWSVSALTVLIWIFEGARVYFAAQALGVDLSVTSALFVALLASLLTTFPFTPAGVGVVEFGIVKALERFDVTTADATALALVDRGIASYTVILIGGLLYLVSKRK